MIGSMATVRIQLTPTARAAADARAAIGAWLRDERVDEAAADDILMVVSELVSNSVRHAMRSDDTAFWLSAERDDQAVRLMVHDDGTEGTVGLRRSETSGDRIGGFGLRLVAAVATAWGVERDELGTVVWARVPL
jgi:anti-sigma regulatory factor (Ser/Thr protein kinase)